MGTDILDDLLTSLTSDCDSIGPSVDPVKIRSGPTPTRIGNRSLWVAIAFALTVVALLVLFVGLGVTSHSTPQRTITPVHRSDSVTGNDPWVLTPDPDDPGWACKEGTSEAGPGGGSMQQIQTID
jgi:hypothetical protein